MLIAIALLAAAAGGFLTGWVRNLPSSPFHVGSTSATLSGQALQAKVDPTIVDIVSTLGYQGGESAGTGIVLTSTGEILTNNHVINGATRIEATDVGNGQTYTANVVGYDTAADLAVLQLQGASGLPTASIGNSDKVAVGAAVVALGNAGGQGGTPVVASGTVTALNQSITASDESGRSSEQLSGLIEDNADVQAGDSGGPLVDTAGKVVGINTAASARFQFQDGASNAFAIPINTALAVAKQIEASGSANGSASGSSGTVHLGTTALLGVELTASSDGSDGAEVVGVIDGSPAAGAGIGEGDVITSVDGTPITSPSSLTSVMQKHHPGDEVSVIWTDASGQSNDATVTLGTGPSE